MSKQDQVLIIHPQHELEFVGTMTSSTTSFITLTNPSDRTVGFKIKTTAPKKYCVRPNSGLLKPKASTNISVCLQSLDLDHSEKNKHKFMVQTVFVPDGEINHDSLWKDIKEDAVMSTKLKCVFKREDSNADGAELTSAEITNAPVTNSAPSSHEDKAKRIGDSPSVHHQDGELQKAAKEVKQLREDESSLRHENMMLKEQIVKLQLLCKSEGQGQLGLMRPASSVMQQAQPVQPVMVIIAIIVGMVGIVLGKFIL